jgi:histidyl-tRNA synthetase
MPISTKPVKGMRDFSPTDSALRAHVQSIILSSYKSHGFHLIETPVMENIDLLQNADGGENLSMLFKVLKRGEKLKLDGPIAHENDLVDYGMRFDLTLPLARFYANSHSTLPQPFKTIQFGYAWRAERSQKGRYRQLMQCDIDYIGSASHNVEIELIHVTGSTLNKLDFNNFTVRVNDRRILEQLATHCGVDNKAVAGVLVTLDKLDKIGVDGIRAELKQRDLSDNSIEKLTAFLNTYTEGALTLESIGDHISGIEPDVISNLQEVISTCNAMSGGNYSVEFDLSLVRGMGYYTGPIFEVASSEFGSSLAGGGRYDNMIGKFLKNRQVPACGFSIGFERILYILQERDHALTQTITKSAILYDSKAMNGSENELTKLFAAAEQLRSPERIVSLEIKQKNLKQQLALLKQVGFTEFAQAGPNSEPLSFKSID